jgi:hypothetical protein
MSIPVLSHADLCYVPERGPGHVGQAAAGQELQALLEVCSRSFSAWFLAHLPPLLSQHPAAPATLGRHLRHLASNQVRACCLIRLCDSWSSSTVDSLQSSHHCTMGPL